MGRIIDVIILVTGVALLVVAFNEYGAFGSRASRFLGLGISNRVLAFFIIGSVCTAYGVVRTLTRK